MHEATFLPQTHTMNNPFHAKPSSSYFSCPNFFTIIILILINHLPYLSSPSTLDSFVYVGCSHLKFTPGDPYDFNLHSILNSITTASSASSFNAFNISLPSSTDAATTVVIYGLFQCRGDLSSSDCHNCVSKAVSRLGISCAGAAAGALQLEGCFVRYDNTSFFGVEDKTVVSEKCGPSVTEDDETARDAAMAYLASGAEEYFKVGESGKIHTMAQCVQDLSVADCQDCLTEAIQRLKSECGASAAAWGDMFLGKCYARYSERGFNSTNDRDHNEMERTLAIFFGIVAGIAILIIILTIVRNVYGPKGGK